MDENGSTEPAVYYPQRWRGWFALCCGLFMFGLWLVVTLAFALMPPPASDPNAKPVGAGPGIILALILWPFAGICFSIGWGIVRSRVVITADKLDLTTHSFAIWSPLRKYPRLQLPWSEVQGVEIFEQTNPYAPEGVQKDYVIHTPQGRFSVSNILWPQAEEIAARVTERIGRAIGDVPETVQHAVADRARDSLGLKLMHGCGMVAVVLCGGMFLLLLIALFGGMPFADFARAAMVCGIGFSAGASMWKWRMTRKGPPGA